MNGSTLVCFALREEAVPFRKAVAERPNVAVLLTGVGRTNAERTFRESLAKSSPEIVLSCGFAGGLDPELPISAVLFDTRDAGLRDRLLAAGARAGRFHCVDRVAATAAEKTSLRSNTGADAVEMESAVLRAICEVRGIRYATVRVISDIAGEDLPLDFNELMTPNQELNFSKLAGSLMKAPGKIPALIRFQKQTHAAAEKLAMVLARTVA